MHPDGAFLGILVRFRTFVLLMTAASAKAYRYSVVLNVPSVCVRYARVGHLSYYELTAKESAAILSDYGAIKAYLALVLVVAVVCAAGGVGVRCESHDVISPVAECDGCIA